MSEINQGVKVVKEDFSGEKNFLSSIDSNNIKVVFVPSKRKAVRKVDVTIEGVFSINTITLLKDRISGVFENYDYVHITLNNIQQLDLTVVQLFYVLKTIYGSNGKTITIDAKLSKEDKLLLHKCGFSDLLIPEKTNTN